MRNAMTIDVEDYFQVSAFEHHISRESWDRLPCRVERNMDLILTLLDAAKDVEELDLPAFRLHALKGNQKGRWAVTVRANWRITFGFKGGQAVDVDFEDYH